MSQRVPSAGAAVADLFASSAALYDYPADDNYYAGFAMYSPYATSNSHEKSTFVSLDGLNSGVPTRTTATLTPTTLRSIEQTVLELTNDLSSHGREAGFVPPLVEPSQPIPAQTQNNSNLQQQHEILSDSNRPNIQTQLVGSESSHSSIVQQSQPQGRKNMGGRRPARTVGMSPEEEERRKVRRERNKMAAARCRQRRMDHTNSLLEETEALEQKKHSLQEEINSLQNVKLELETLLEEHKFVCRLASSSPREMKPIIKSEIDICEERNQNNSSNGSTISSSSSHDSTGSSNSSNSCEKRNPPMMSFRPSRPSSLPVGNAVNFNNNNNNNNTNSNNHNRPNSLMLFNCEPKDQYKSLETPTFMKAVPEVAGVPITTPSNGIPFNFDSLMEGGTGLTPVSTPLAPSCSTQQRNNNLTSAVDLSSPETNPPKLVSL